MKSTTTGDTDSFTTKNFDLHIFPNPSEGLFTVDGELPGVGPVYLDIMDATGKVLFQSRIETNKRYLYE